MDRWDRWYPDRRTGHPFDAIYAGDRYGEDELVQGLGVYFTVATVALAFSLTKAGLLRASTALPDLVAMAGAFAGMFMGQIVRSRIRPEAFRRWFLMAMIFLAGSAIYKSLAS